MQFLTMNGIAYLLDEQDADLARESWTFQDRHGPYRRIAIRRNTYTVLYLRLLVAARKLGRELTDQEKCFHKNKDATDCRRENILIGSSSHTRIHARKRAHTTSQYKGVSFEKRTGKWVATVKIDQKTKWLGRYGTPEDAAKAYNTFMSARYGEYVWLNDI